VRAAKVDADSPSHRAKLPLPIGRALSLRSARLGTCNSPWEKFLAPAARHDEFFSAQKRRTNLGAGAAHPAVLILLDPKPKEDF
jgi:hypothetical protein